MFLHRTVVSGLSFDGCCEVNNFKGTLCFVCQQKAVGESHKAVKSFFLSESLKIIPNIPFNTPKAVGEPSLADAKRSQLHEKIGTAM